MEKEEYNNGLIRFFIFIIFDVNRKIKKSLYFKVILYKIKKDPIIYKKPR
jgi:hypothetical protein